VETTITDADDREADAGATSGSGRAPRARLWVKYAAGSVVASILSQIALTVCYGLLDASAAVASVVAFLVGAVPNYLLNRAWAWNDRDVRSRRGAVATYIAVIGVTNLLAIGSTTLADAWVRNHVASHGVRTLLVDIAYVASYGVMFVLKFLLFDGVVFNNRRSRHQVRSTTRA
jgi:putative flippase GtrA